MLYGILKSSTNTGLDDEILILFSTPLQVLSNTPVFANDAYSLRRIISTTGAHRWEITANLQLSNNSADFLSHSVENNYSKVFEVRMPQVYGKEAATATTVAGSFNSSSTTISFASRIPAGEFISFSGHNKVYLVTKETPSGSDQKIFPPLRQGLSGNSVNVGGNVTLKVRYDLDTVIGIGYSDGILSDPGSVKFIEAL